MLISKRRQTEGIRRLLSSPKDLIVPGGDAFEAFGEITATPEHRKLFTRYTREITRAATDALEWWQDTVDSAVADARGRKQGTDDAWLKRPAGPASDPTFIAVVRKYWLACHELNQTRGQAQRVPPEVFILQWLVDAGKSDVVEVLACMPYWPIGMDHKGHWA